ncbi:hypothetical protein ACFL1S_03925 [Pseudomonadota bacterium]
MKTRLVSFSNNSVAIDYDEVAAQSIVDFLFSDIRGTTQNGHAEKPISRLTISSTSDGGFSLDHRHENFYRGRCGSRLALTLEQKTMHPLVDKNTTGLALHAAAVNSGDQGIVIPGISGAGKSTMAFWLTSKGLNYLTDELVNIPLGTSLIEGFTRPIHIKIRDDCLLRDEFDIESDDPHILKTNAVSMISSRMLNSEHLNVRPEIKLILFPNATVKKKNRLEVLSQAETALKLVKCLVNGRNLVNHGFDEISRLAKQVPAYNLYYSGFDELPSLLRGVLPGLDLQE